MTAEQSNRAKSWQDTKETTGGGGSNRLEIQEEVMSFWSHQANLRKNTSFSTHCRNTFMNPDSYAGVDLMEKKSYVIAD